MKLRCLLLGRWVVTNLDSILKSRHYFVNKGPSSQGYGFSSGHEWKWELDCEESWALKNWCFWTVVLEKTLESLLDCKEIQPVHPQGNQSWILIGKTDDEAETPILWPPDVKNLTHWKRHWCWERLKVGGEGDDRGWDGSMASPTQWTWVWVNSGSWWWTGRPSVLWFMGSQRVGHNWETELKWTRMMSPGETSIAKYYLGEDKIENCIEDLAITRKITYIFIFWSIKHLIIYLKETLVKL